MSQNFEWSLLSAVHAANDNNFIPWENENGNESPATLEKFALPSIEARFDKQLISEDLFNNLSEQAKEVIDIVINSPVDVIRQFSNPKHGNISYNKLKNYIKKNLHMKRNVADRVFDEITDFVTECYN